MIYPFDLHSNMVRFIIRLPKIKSITLYFIYIPIWLDLLFVNNQEDDKVVVEFTFQYG